MRAVVGPKSSIENAAFAAFVARCIRRIQGNLTCINIRALPSLGPPTKCPLCLGLSRNSGAIMWETRSTLKFSERFRKTVTDGASCFIFVLAHFFSC